MGPPQPTHGERGHWVGDAPPADRIDDPHQYIEKMPYIIYGFVSITIQCVKGLGALGHAVTIDHGVMATALWQQKEEIEMSHLRFPSGLRSSAENCRLFKEIRSLGSEYTSLKGCQPTTDAQTCAMDLAMNRLPEGIKALQTEARNRMSDGPPGWQEVHCSTDYSSSFHQSVDNTFKSAGRLINNTFQPHNSGGNPVGDVLGFFGGRNTRPRNQFTPSPTPSPQASTPSESEKLHAEISGFGASLNIHTTSELNSFLDGGCDVKTLWQRLQTNALKSTDETYIATGGALRALVKAITERQKQSLSADQTNRLAALLSYLYREAYKIGPSTDCGQKHSALLPLTQENAGTILNGGHYSAAVLKRLFGDESIIYTTKKTSKCSFFRMPTFLRTKQNTSHSEMSLTKDFTAAIHSDNYNTNGSLGVFGPLFKKVRVGVQSQQCGPDFLTTLLSIKYEKDSNPSNTSTLSTNADTNQLKIEPKSTNSYKLTYDHKMYQLLFCGTLFKRLTAYYPIPRQSRAIDFSQETDFLRLLGEENSLQSKPIGSINFTIASDSSSTQQTPSQKPMDTSMIETVTESLKTREAARNKLKKTQEAIEDGKDLEAAKNIKDGSQSLGDDSFTSLFASVSAVLANCPASPPPTTGNTGLLGALDWLLGK